MKTLRFPDAEWLIAFLLSLLTFTWGSLLWKYPKLYNPDNLFYRKMYLWYSAWFRTESDESFQLTDYEVKRAGVLIAFIGIASLVIILALIFG